MTREEEYQNALKGYMNLDVHINKTLRLIGISAIKKQIPKKPNNIVIKPRLYTGECPMCGKKMSKGTKYCTRCGQALKWGDPYDN